MNKYESVIIVNPNVEENLGSGGFRQTREQSIFDRINSDDGLSEEELKNLHLAGVHESDIINLLKDAFGI